MIVLTESSPVSAVIGGTGKTGYDQLTLASFTFSSTIPPQVTAQVSVLAAAVPDAPPSQGTLAIVPGSTTTLTISVPGLQAFPPVVKLSSAQNDQLTKLAADLRQALEQMLIDVGVVSGTIEK